MISILCKGKTITFLFVLGIFSNSIVNGQGKSSSNHINIGKNVNSAYDEQFPVLSPDGKTLYFTRVAHPDNAGGKRDKGDIWFSKLDSEGNWQQAQNLGNPVNNNSKNIVLGFSTDGKQMYLKHLYKKGSNTTIPQGISVSTIDNNGKWGFPEKLPINYFQNKSEDLSISLSKNGKVMILSMESFAKRGAEDLYVSFLGADGVWSEPKNLGSTVNSAYQELTPFLADDNKTLFFSSNGWKGMGSKDIFMTQRLDDTWTNWSKPVNLGVRFNTEGMELSYFIPSEGDFAYIISTQNSDGYGDINKILIKPEDRPKGEGEEEFMAAQVFEAAAQPKLETKTEEVVPVVEETTNEVKSEIKQISFEGKVINHKSGKEISAKLQFIPVKPETVEGITINAVSGLFETVLTPGSTYKIKVSSPGYMTVEDILIIPEGNSSIANKTFSLIPLEIGTTVNLNSVLFTQGTADLLEESFEELDKVAKMMLENPTLEIELSGHTDNRGNSKLNIKLSQDRADKVKAYLIEKGVEGKRMVGKGYGGTRPMASNNSEETRKLNRRVEFTILKR